MGRLHRVGKYWASEMMGYMPIDDAHFPAPTRSLNGAHPTCLFATGTSRKVISRPARNGSDLVSKRTEPFEYAWFLVETVQRGGDRPLRMSLRTSENCEDCWNSSMRSGSNLFCSSFCNPLLCPLKYFPPRCSISDVPKGLA